MKAAWLAWSIVVAAPALAAGPETITGFAPDDLDRRAVADTADIWLFVPNAQAALAPGIGSAVEPNLRGLGGGEALTGRAPAVGTIIDDVALPSIIATRFGFFDLDRAEVVRGPQGVAGGAQMEGGALTIRLARPADETAGYVETGFGNRNLWTLRGSLDIPLSPAIALKFSGFRRDGRGYVHNSTTGDHLNDGDMAGVRAAAELRPAERIRWNVSVAGIDSDGENLWNGACADGCSGRMATTGMPAERVPGGAPQYPGLAISGRKGAEPLRNHTRTLLVTSNLSYGGAAHGLEIITGYVRIDGRFGLDFADGRPLPDAGGPLPPPRGWRDGGATLLADTTQDQFSQEARLSGRFGWLGYRVGGYYAEGDSSADTADLMTVDSGSGTPLLLADRAVRLHREEKAGYGTLSAHWGTLTLTGGVRYTDETLRLGLSDNRADCAPGLCLDDAALRSAGIPARLSTRRWTPAAGIEWTPRAGLLLFASARRGYRQGEWNVRGLDAAAFQPAATEGGWTYEAGLRGRWLDGRLRAGLTGFVMRIDDAQASWSAVDPRRGALQSASATVGQLRNEGVEVELGASPWEGLDLNAAAGWQNARYAPDAAMRGAAARCQAAGPADPACGYGIVTADGRIADPARAPDFTASIGGSWAIRWVSGESFITPAAYLSYQSDIALDPADTIHAPSRWMVQASLALTTDDGLWMLAAECSNCLDTDRPATGWAGLSYPTAPRTWLIKARRRF